MISSVNTERDPVTKSNNSFGASLEIVILTTSPRLRLFKAVSNSRTKSSASSSSSKSLFLNILKVHFPIILYPGKIIGKNLSNISSKGINLISLFLPFANL